MDKQEKIPHELLKKIKKIEIRSSVLVNEAISGNYNSIFKGYGMEFEEVREYYPGDDYRTIDWNVTARHQSPYVKRYREERELNVMLLIDSSGSLKFGSKDETKKDKLTLTASMIAFAALSNSDRIGACFFTNIIEKVILPSKNRNVILRLIREIVFLNPSHSGTDLNIALDFALETMKRRGVIFILSDFFGELDIKKLYIAKKKHDIIPVVLTDQFEENPINVGLVEMIDNETHEIRLIDTSNRSYKESVLKRKEKRDIFLKELEKYNIQPMFIKTDDDVENIIMRYFKTRAKKIIR